jgi:hypothetical protein
MVTFERTTSNKSFAMMIVRVMVSSAMMFADDEKEKFPDSIRVFASPLRF